MTSLSHSILEFIIHFNTPYRVASGQSRTGVNTAGFHDGRIPGTALKGMMRNAARDLDLPRDCIVDVFGSESPNNKRYEKPSKDAKPLHESRADTVGTSGYMRQSPWAWSDCIPEPPPAAQASLSSEHFSGGTDNPRLLVRHRVRINEESGRPADGALFSVEEYGATSGRFTVRRFAGDHYLSDAQLCDHRHVLEAAARVMSAIGGDRRRGLGWVSVTAVEPTSEDVLAQRIARLREQDER